MWLTLLFLKQLEAAEKVMKSQEPRQLVLEKDIPLAGYLMFLFYSTHTNTNTEHLRKL